MNTHGERAAWFLGGAGVCPPVAAPAGKIYRLLLLGPPGSGKGTQAEHLKEALNACHLSMGDIFRAAQELDEEDRTPAMREALSAMSEGRLVADATVIALLRERVRCVACPGGFLLDGFPRTLAQAHALEGILREQRLDLTAVLYYDAPHEDIVRRISGRLTCRQCKSVYHLEHNPPPSPGKCGVCGGELYRRPDDQPEAVWVRLRAYERSTAPLVAYYEERGLLRTIPAVGKPGEVFERTRKCLGL